MNQRCAICVDSQEFRVLQCRHCFCINCLMVLRGFGEEEITCPACRKPDSILPEDLPLSQNFIGRRPIYPDFHDEEIGNEFTALLSRQLTVRRRTIDHLRFVADELSSMELKCAGAKIGGSATGIVGGILAVVGFGMSFSGVLAPAGVPIGIAGAAVAGTGGLTTGITLIVENVLKKIGIDKVETDLKEDYFRAIQISVLMKRAVQDHRFARRWKINYQDAVSFVSIVPRTLKVGLLTAVAVGRGVARAAATTGMHIAGIVFASLIIPVDIAQVIVSSIQIRHKKPSEIVQTMRSTAEKLENKLRVFLIRENYFQLIHLRDEDGNSRWAYVVTFPSNRDNVINALQLGHQFPYENLRELGDVIEEGYGENVPCRVRDMIDQMWYDIERQEHAETTYNHQDDLRVEEFELLINK